MVTVTVTNKRRKSEASSLNPLNRVLDWYYEEQAEMNYCASLLQTPISIEHVWGEEKRKRKAQAEITPFMGLRIRPLGRRFGGWYV